MNWIRRLRKRDSEKGATLVEFSFIFMFLLMIAIGTFEMGMALRDWLSVTIATREGARVAAASVNFEAADCVVLEATAGALRSFHRGQIAEVSIFKSDANGIRPPAVGSGLTVSYRPEQPGDPEPVCPTWTHISGTGANWQPDDRINIANPYWIGVQLKYTHDWYTNFLWWSGTADWSDTAIFRVEPPPPTLDD